MFFVAARNGKIRCFVFETSPCAICQGRPKIRACVRAMEKFRVFTDEAVGVNPFVQQPYKSSLTRNVVGALLLVVRVPLLAIIVPLLVASNIVGSALPGLPGRLTRAVLERFFARLVLLVMGFTSLPSTSPHRQAVRLRPSPSRPLQTVRGGDVLVAPSSSYVDVLYASAAYAPVFAFPCAASSSSGGGGAGLLEVVGLVEALRRTLRPAHGSSASSGAHPSSGRGGRARPAPRLPRGRAHQQQRAPRVLVHRGGCRRRGPPGGGGGGGGNQGGPDRPRPRAPLRRRAQGRGRGRDRGGLLALLRRRQSQAASRPPSHAAHERPDMHPPPRRLRPPAAGLCRRRRGGAAARRHDSNLGRCRAGRDGAAAGCAAREARGQGPRGLCAGVGGRCEWRRWGGWGEEGQVSG
jgi:hypothetical protein